MEPILLLWTYTERTAPLNEYVLTRVLTNHGFSQPLRSTVQLRTFRAERTLTTVTHLQSPIAYLVIDNVSLAVQPASSVMPLLSNLLSPFVMGLTKQARAAASTTAEVARPTALPGVSLLLTSIAFPGLTIYNLPSGSIVLEGSKEFLEECLPEGLGERKYAVWEGAESSWEGTERTRKVSQMLVGLLDL